jgi:hypothetical protein
MTAHLSPAQAPASRGPREDPHRSLHSETGPQPAEHPGRSKNPLIKVAGLAWLEFEKPDLDAAERFGTDFGFTVADRTPETLLLRGRWAGPACLVVRRGPHSRFAGTAYQAAARDDLDRLARGTGGTATAHSGGDGAACFQALTGGPGLTIIVRPDRVIAAVATRGRLPRLPWSVPAATVPRASQMIPRPST